MTKGQASRPTLLFLAFPPSPHCLLQVHKFLNRNRDHLDPAVVEMLAQSQLQVPCRPFWGPHPSTLCSPILPFLPGHSCSKGLPSSPGHLDRGLAHPGSLGVSGRLGCGQAREASWLSPFCPYSWWAACSRKQSPRPREAQANPPWPLTSSSP